MWTATKLNKPVKSLIIGFLLLIIGCEKHLSLSPLQSASITSKTEKQLNILPLGKGSSLLNKETTVSEMITVDYGGTIILNHYGEDGLRIKNRLTILPGTISENAEVSLTVNDQEFKGNLEVVLQPHGITFSDPALLTIYACGLDFSGVNTDSLDLYYDNPVTGKWESMEKDAMYVYPGRGKLYVRNAKIPHFSRYGIGDVR